MRWFVFLSAITSAIALPAAQFPFPHRPPISECCALLSELASPTNLPRPYLGHHELALPMTPTYAIQLIKHWSANAVGSPSCIYTPSSSTTPADIGQVLDRLLTAQCHLAFRSGGHMVVPGYSSPKEEGGILVSLAGRNSLTLLDGEDEEEGNKLVRIGAGLKWAQVYDFLEPHGLAVPGGRTASVGVGGFLLHGGISHLSAEYGLGVDSIVEYEVILPSGKYVKVNAHSEPDLFWALKGGGNNFGLVLSFTLRTYPIPKIWGGTIQFPMYKMKDVLSAMNPFLLGENDPKAAIIPVFLTQSGQSWIYVTLFHSDGNSKYVPPSLQAFLNIPHFSNTLRRTTMAQLGRETNGGPTGLRRFFVTGTLRAHPLTGPLILSKLRDAMMASPYTAIPRLNISFDLGSELDLPVTVDLPPSLNIALPPIATPDLAVMITLQNIPKSILEKGDHSFGLDPEGGPYVAYFALAESSLHRDETLSEMFHTFHEDLQSTAAIYSDALMLDQGLSHPFTYVNDCGYQTFENGSMILQEGIGSYSPAKITRLQEVRDRYDPTRRWSRLVGGWRIPG